MTTNSVFKDKKDRECELINRNCKDSCFCVRDTDGNIFKFFLSDESYKWETQVYLYLVDKGLVPLASPGKSGLQLTYYTSGMLSLRTFIEGNTFFNLSYLFNELFRFVNRFRKYNFIHGNLTVDTIFIKLVGTDIHFYLVDLSHAILENSKSNNSSSPVRNVNLNGRPIALDLSSDIDFISLYISLSEMLKNRRTIRCMERALDTFSNIKHRMKSI